MNRDEWNRTATEQNAKAEQIGAALAIGCVGVPLLVIVVVVIAVCIFS